ncbi:MAG: HAMP domain-containing protein, partial [Clostridiales bacterium]|nr:HAMP domain-containing protein [Clostridiales bacterium]
MFKLNSWYTGRVFFCFFWLNILISSLFAGAVLYHAESAAANNAATARSGNIEVAERYPRGVRLPRILQGVLPARTAGAVRALAVPSDGGRLWTRMERMTYRLWLPRGGVYAAEDYPIGGVARVFLRLFAVLLIFELLYFIGAVGKGARAARRALRPLAELTETARNLNNTQSVLPDARLQDLTGTIDAIDAARLDTRITVGSDRNELKALAGAINGMLSRVNAAYRSQIRFVSDASHELRTPIAVIQGYANLLDRWGKNDQKALQESIEAIKGEAA